nr:hypothetical protein [Tanacetum cinerariifolium]
AEEGPTNYALMAYSTSSASSSNSKEVKPSINKINFVKAITNNNPRETIQNGEQPKQNTHRKRGNQRNWNGMMSHRPNPKLTALKNSYANKKVKTVWVKKVNTAKPTAAVNAAKAKAKHKVLENVSRHSSASITPKKLDYVDAQGRSKHMTWIMSFLTDYEEIDRGYVAFGGNPKGGKITGKCKIKTGKLDFKNVYFVRELKFNLFSVSNICDKKNSVIFTDTECKFDGKADKGFFVGYSLNSKAFRVFNSRTRIVEENLHLRFRENTPNNVGEEDSTNITNRVNTVTSNINAASSSGVNIVGTNISIDLPLDLNIHSLDDIGIFEDSHNDEDVFGTEADFHNLDSTFQVSPIPTTRILKDHPLEQVIRDLHSSSQTKRITKNLEEHGLVLQALKDPSWIEAMQEELLLFKLQDDPDFPDKVYKVKKALYGLHQAPRAWKSTTGGCQFLRCRLISWQCKKQTVVANSITEAEFIVPSSCCGQ